MFSVCYNKADCRDVCLPAPPRQSVTLLSPLLSFYGYIGASLIIHQYIGQIKAETIILAKLFYMDAGERLRLWRKQNNITAGDLARKIGMSPSGVTSFERGEAAMSHKYLAKLNTCFGISIDWLLTGLQQDMSVKEGELFEVFSRLDKSQQDHLVRIAKTFLPQGKEGL